MHYLFLMFIDAEASRPNTSISSPDGVYADVEMSRIWGAAYQFPESKDTVVRQKTLLCGAPTRHRPIFDAEVKETAAGTTSTLVSIYSTNAWPAVRTEEHFR